MEDDDICSEDKVCSPPESPQCSLYIAPSTIPNAGLGVFTAIFLKKGETIGYGDVILPLVDLEFHQGTNDFFNPFSEFLWDSYCFGMQQEADSVKAFAPGLYSVMNCNPAFHNVGRGDFDYDDQVGGHRSENPSFGSMTPYHNGRTVATTDIFVGSELFNYYGDHWFESRYNEFGLIPLATDYKRAESLLKDLLVLEQRLNLTEDATKDLHSILTNSAWESRVLNALPRDYMKDKTVIETSIQSLYQVNDNRSLDELKATGRCLDNIQPKESTLPYAGRGAFATRDLPKGSIVTGSPLVHVPSDKLAYMYESYYDYDQGADVRDIDSFAGFQMWYNYCMGHRNSSVLLCPYGSGVSYINHNQMLANIKLQWAPHGIVSHNETWLTKLPAEMKKDWTTHLGMDYVATRDIKEGEELFLDYGDEWEQAWQDYVENWEPLDEGYTSAAQWNWEHGEDLLLTQTQQEWAYPLPFNLMLRCHPTVYSEEFQDTDKLWPSWKKGHPCQVYARTETEEGEFTYTVHLYHEEYDEAVTRHEVKRDLIAMIDGPYTTDWHRRDAFRHYIGIPDEMFPDAWRNRESDSEK